MSNFCWEGIRKRDKKKYAAKIDSLFFHDHTLIFFSVWENEKFLEKKNLQLFFPKMKNGQIWNQLLGKKCPILIFQKKFWKFFAWRHFFKTNSSFLGKITKFTLKIGVILG
jgi:hypothetical protein